MTVTMGSLTMAQETVIVGEQGWLPCVKQYIEKAQQGAGREASMHV